MAAGLAASFTMAIICHLVARRWPIDAQEDTVPTLLSWISLWSCLSLVNVLPFAGSDGRKILILLTRPKTILVAVARFALSQSPRRPRDWDRDLVKLAFDSACSAEVDEPAVQKWVHALQYNWHADLGDSSRAQEHLELLASDSAWWAWEAVWFEIYTKGNSARALEKVQIAETMSDALDENHWIVLRGKAAISAAAGLSKEARGLAELAICALQMDIDTASGITDAIKTDLWQLLRSFENSPAVGNSRLISNR